MNTLRIRPEFFAALPTEPNLTAAARRADMSYNTAKRWIESPDELEAVELDTLYAVLSGVAQIDDEGILSLKLGDILRVVGRVD